MSQSEVKRKVDAVRRIVCYNIEKELHPRPVIVYKRNPLPQAIFELKHPKDSRLTPLTDAQIEQDLRDLGLIDY